VATSILELTRARIDVAGIPAIDGLSLTSTGERVLVLGAARALFQAASGLLGVSHGEVRLSGVASLVAVRTGVAAGAPLDPPLPAKWTPFTYAVWSARLAGHSVGAARALAHDALERMKMGAFDATPLGKATPQVRRATVIAAALATGAKTLLLEDPVVGLPDEVARNVARVLTQATRDRAWVVFAGRMSLVSPLAMEADEAIVVSGSAVIAQGAPADLASRERSFALRVYGEAQDFARIVGERGARVSGEGERLVVDLGEHVTVKDLLHIARESKATILELYPLAHALT
jgi:ABC-type multidrug transport system ATPase subunit